ncbi:nitrous oxide reductase accessory protein NosL [Halorutilales archaeon Cl-col2-1]
MENDDSITNITRRRLLAVTGAGLSVGVAGCTGGGNGGEGGDTNANANESGGDTGEGGETNETDGDSESGEAQETSLSEPVSPVPDDKRCAVCNMKAAEYPDSNAQLSLSDGGRVYFCSSSCFTAYYAYPDSSKFSAPAEFSHGDWEDKVAHAWVHDYGTKEYIDATEASYVLEHNADRIEMVMGDNPLPYGAEEDAVAYTEEYDDLSKHDVVSLMAFDRSLAERYSPNFIAESEVEATPITESVDVPDDAECTVCGMKAAKFPDWNAQASHENGDRDFFCSPGCMTTYYATPETFNDGKTQDDIVGVWAHDFETKDLIDARLADYVLVTNADRVDDPMMKNPLPFSNPDDATAYIDEYDDLSEDDIIPLTSFDMSLAETYRKKFVTG